MTPEEAIKWLTLQKNKDILWDDYSDETKGIRENAELRIRIAYEMAIEALKKSSWMPITHREMTEEEKEFFNVEFEDTKILDCNLPDDGEEVLISTRQGGVFVDAFCNDIDDCYFEGYDIDEVTAWMPLPKAYKEEEEV